MVYDALQFKNKIYSNKKNILTKRQYLPATMQGHQRVKREIITEELQKACLERSDKLFTAFIQKIMVEYRSFYQDVRQLHCILVSIYAVTVVFFFEHFEPLFMSNLALI